MKTYPRFFVDAHLEINTTIELPEATTRHAGLALRLRSEDIVCLFNNKGGQYIGSIYFEKKKALVTLKQFEAIERENKRYITLVQGIASNEKMDWIIEKAVEMGVQRFIPVTADRSTVQLKDERAKKRLQRWQSIVISASEQCGRNRLMSIEPIHSLDQALQKIETNTPCLFADPKAEHTLKEFKNNTSIALFIGPEGGWSEKEYEQAKTKAHPIQVGSRILRTETAGIAICSMLLANELETIQ